jgi:alpha-ketoglutarate-dependent taurine dioxygenase
MTPQEIRDRLDAIEAEEKELKEALQAFQIVTFLQNNPNAPGLSIQVPDNAPKLARAILRQALEENRQTIIDRAIELAQMETNVPTP